MSTIPSADQVFEKILSKFDAKGDGHYGENVTEQEHALQCAAAAERAGEPDALVVACLLHDYGHLLHEMDQDFSDQGLDDKHEDLGAVMLSKHFPPEVVEPIRMHVDAKRYLCARDAEYDAGLSETSRKSLAIQGGPMSDEEADAFEANPHFEWAIRLRKHDDAAKTPNAKTKSLEDYRTMVTGCVCAP